MHRQGATGALLDVYEQAIAALKRTIEDIPAGHLTTITDPLTSDENCRSVQTILSHVVNSGYGYATSIYNINGNDLNRPDKTFHLTIEEYLSDLDKVFAFTEKVFAGIHDYELEEMNDSKKIKTRWGQLYDIEQLTEHAIVHILRHKRQIESIKFN